MDYSDDFFKSLTDQSRRRIINLLIHYPAFHVNQIVDVLDLPQSKASKHLAILRKAGWLLNIRREKWIYYKISPEISSALLSALTKIFESITK